MDGIQEPLGRRKRWRWLVISAILLAFSSAPIYRHFAVAGVLPEDFHELHWVQLRSAFSAEAAPDVTDQSFIFLRRTGCFGECPAYRVTVFGSGRVEYEGKLFVCDIGPRTVTIDRQAARKLISDIERMGFFDIGWQPGNIATDNPTAVTRLSIGKKLRTLCDYHGDDGVPRVMRRLEDSIDEVAGTARWLPQGGGFERFCIAPDGSRHKAAGL